MHFLIGIYKPKTAKYSLCIDKELKNGPKKHF